MNFIVCFQLQDGAMPGRSLLEAHTSLIVGCTTQSSTGSGGGIIN